MWCLHVGWCRIKVLRSSFHDRFACGAGVLLARVGQAIRNERMCPATTRTKTRLCTKRCDSVVVPFPMRCPSSHRTMAGKGNLSLELVRDGIIGNLTFSLALSSTCGRAGNCRFPSFFFFKCYISHCGLHLPCLLSSLSLLLSFSFSRVLSEQYRDTTEKKNAFLATNSSRDSRSRFITNRNRRVSEGGGGGGRAPVSLRMDKRRGRRKQQKDSGGGFWPRLFGGRRWAPALAHGAGEPGGGTRGRRERLYGGATDMHVCVWER